MGLFSISEAVLCLQQIVSRGQLDDHKQTVYKK